jgi:hypothetical protein
LVRKNFCDSGEKRVWWARHLPSEDDMVAVKTSGTFKGKSNKLGFGGRAAQLKAQGVPGGVIGDLARAAGAAPGGPNFHGGKKKK